MTPVESAAEAKAFYDAQRNPVGGRIPVMRTSPAVVKPRHYEMARREMLAVKAKAVCPRAAGE